jgi:hypothetical protein
LLQGGKAVSIRKSHEAETQSSPASHGQGAGKHVGKKRKEGWAVGAGELIAGGVETVGKRGLG